jgi:hypothetical protein
MDYQVSLSLLEAPNGDKPEVCQEPLVRVLVSAEDADMAMEVALAAIEMGEAPVLVKVTVEPHHPPMPYDCDLRGTVRHIRVAN